jgi:tRNA1Val (adenine37-N6)-methyltransferase
MSNNYFQFKQFTIFQDKCAMKVCTDACLFGAVIADSDQLAANCLDIGTGTGLLSLMFAQKNSTAIIDAVEINTDAAEQAIENITGSPWAERIRIYNEDILTFNPGPQDSVSRQYDFIFSNPPFFEDDLQSPDDAKNNAKHNTSLTLSGLISFADIHLTGDGYFAVLLPYHRVDHFIEEATKTGFHHTKQILVKQTLKHPFFRGILFFDRRENKPQFSELIIKDIANNYTPEFSAALKDYYLFL